MALFNRLSFIKKKHENDDIYTFYFSPKQKIEHKAGQHGLFLLPGLHRPHPFTFSSAPGEEYITFTTHVDTGSRYKKRLMKMTPNDRITLAGPLGGFTLESSSNEHILLAQGVGITPFRSMLVHADADKLPATTTLIHVDSKTHTFRSLTEKLATKAHYPTNPDEFRELVRKQDSSQLFYISGSPRFVRATKDLLEEMGVRPSSIKVDSFMGY